MNSPVTPRQLFPSPRGGGVSRTRFRRDRAMSNPELRSTPPPSFPHSRFNNPFRSRARARGKFPSYNRGSQGSRRGIPRPCRARPCNIRSRRTEPQVPSGLSPGSSNPESSGESLTPKSEAATGKVQVQLPQPSSSSLRNSIEVQGSITEAAGLTVGIRESLVKLEEQLRGAFGNPIPENPGRSNEDVNPVAVVPSSPAQLVATPGTPKPPPRRSPRLAGRASHGANPEVRSRSIFMLSPEQARNRRRHLGIDFFCSTTAQRICTRILCYLDGHFALPISVSELHTRAEAMSEARFLKIDSNVSALVFRMLRTMARHPGGATSPGAFSAGLEVPRGISALDWHLWSVRGALDSQ